MISCSCLILEPKDMCATDPKTPKRSSLPLWEFDVVLLSDGSENPPKVMKNRFGPQAPMVSEETEETAEVAELRSALCRANLRIDMLAQAVEDLQLHLVLEGPNSAVHVKTMFPDAGKRTAGEKLKDSHDKTKRVLSQ